MTSLTEQEQKGIKVLRARMEAEAKARSEACMAEVADVLKRHNCEIEIVLQFDNNGWGRFLRYNPLPTPE